MCNISTIILQAIILPKGKPNTNPTICILSLFLILSLTPIQPNATRRVKIPHNMPSKQFLIMLIPTRVIKPNITKARAPCAPRLCTYFITTTNTNPTPVLNNFKSRRPLAGKL